MSAGESIRRSPARTGGEGRVVVVGAGPSGLMATLRLLGLGVAVDLVSLSTPRASRGALDGAGVNAALDGAGDGDDPASHLADALAASGGGASRALLAAMVEAAPRIVNGLDRAGVPFLRGVAGRLSPVRQGGSSHARSALAGASSGLQIVAALEAQLRRHEADAALDARGLSRKAEPLLRRFEGWEMVATVRDDAGTCAGIVAQDLRTMSFRAFPADAVVLACGGASAIFGAPAVAPARQGTVLAALLEEGAVLANLDRVQLHPTALPGGFKRRLVPDLARAWGARIWVPRKASDERAPGELSERDRESIDEGHPGQTLASLRRAWAGRALEERFAYLDFARVDRRLRSELGTFLTTHAQLGGADPFAAPLRVVPAVECMLGGLWVDHEVDGAGRLLESSPRTLATSIPGVHAAGEVQVQLGGGGFAPGDAMLAALFSGELAASGAASHQRAMARSAIELPRSIFERAEQRATAAYQALQKADGPAEGESVGKLRAALGEVLWRGLDPFADADPRALDTDLEALSGRIARARAQDDAAYANQGLPALRRLQGDLLLARAMAHARARTATTVGAGQPSLTSEAARFHLVQRVGQQETATAEVELASIERFTYACVGKVVEVSDAVETAAKTL